MKDLIKILLVEDVPSDAEILWYELTRNGLHFEKKHVETRKDYVYELMSFRPDLIISDYALPQFDGMTALKLKNDLSPLTPFILVTGSVNEEIAVECMKAGANDYVLKQNLSRLIPSIRAAMSKTEILLEKEAAEKELRESEEKFRSIFENVQDLYYESSLDGTLLEISPSILALSHGQYKREDLIGMSMSELYSFPEERQLLMNRLGEKGSITDYEITMRNRDGSLVSCSVSAKLLFGSDGNPVKIIGSMRDISERKKAEEALKQSYAFSESLLRTIPFGMDIVDEEGNILFQSDNFKRLFGEKTIGKKCWEVYRDDKTQCIDCPLKKPITIGETAAYESYGVLGNRIFEINHTGMLYNGKKALLELFQDITERKKMEQKVIESEAYYRTLIDVSPDGIIITDITGIVSYCSLKALEIFGVPNGEKAVGTPILNWLAPDSHNLVMERFNHIVLGNTAPETREYELRKFDGTIFWGELSSSPLTGANGTPAEMLIVCRDVSVRKTAELELIKSKEQAEESDRLKTAFLHNISHEIRTPMNAIIGFSSLLSEPGLDIASQKSFVGHISQSSFRLLEILNNIIEVSNIEAGILKIMKSEANLNKMLEMILKEYQAKAREKGIKLTMEPGLPDSRTDLLYDYGKIKSILTSLLNNAFKFTHKGEVSLGYKPNGNFLEFYVSDTGIGIPQEHHNKVFSRFYQVDNMLNRDYEGTGLGLSISKAYVELLGGKIWLTSKPGKGSVFYFTIPYCQNGKTAVLKTQMSREKTHYLNSDTSPDHKTDLKGFLAFLSGPGTTRCQQTTYIRFRLFPTTDCLEINNLASWKSMSDSENRWYFRQ